MKRLGPVLGWASSTRQIYSLGFVAGRFGILFLLGGGHAKDLPSLFPSQWRCIAAIEGAKQAQIHCNIQELDSHSVRGRIS